MLSSAISVLRITELAPGIRRLTWSSVPGKNYQVYSTPNPTIAFEPLSGIITAFEPTLPLPIQRLKRPMNSIAFVCPSRELREF